MPRLSLRTKLLGAVLVVLLPVLALFFYDYYADLYRRTEAVLDSQMQTAQTVAVLVDATFGSLQDVAWSFAKDPVILTFDPNTIDPYLRQFAEVYPLDSDIAIFTSDGSNVGSMRVLPTPRPGVADREYFQRVMATNAPFISNVIISRATGEPIGVAAVPIRNDAGAPIGVAIVSLRLEFSQILASVNRQPGQHIFIADRQGILAFHTPQPEISRELLAVSSHPAVREALRTGQFRGMTESGILLPGSRLMAITRASGSGWLAGITVPTDAALAPVRESLQVTLAGYIAILLLSVLAALWLAQRLLEPLGRLREHAIALGRGQLQERVNIRTGDELQTVGEAFNTMADEVQSAARLREEFMTVASHELRTPLTTIRGYSQLLLRKDKDETNRKALDAIVRSTERIDHLVQDMLEVSKIRSTGVQLDKEQFDLAEMVRVLADQLQLISPRHRLIVRAKGPVDVNADEERIEIVLTNLIDNAVRYSPQGGDVEIEVADRDQEVEVTVIDHGLGIPKDKQKLVFEPFFQVYPATAGLGGMGLGLYTSKQIVEAHRGRIWFESEEGKGSTFHFSLPRRDP